MLYFVVGRLVSESGRVSFELLTRRSFDCREDAEHYASTCHPSYAPMVVATIT